MTCVLGLGEPPENMGTEGPFEEEIPDLESIVFQVRNTVCFMSVVNASCRLQPIVETFKNLLMDPFAYFQSRQSINMSETHNIFFDFI